MEHGMDQSTTTHTQPTPIPVQNLITHHMHNNGFFFKFSIIIIIIINNQSMVGTVCYTDHLSNSNSKKNSQKVFPIKKKW